MRSTRGHTFPFCMSSANPTAVPIPVADAMPSPNAELPAVGPSCSVSLTRTNEPGSESRRIFANAGVPARSPVCGGDSGLSADPSASGLRKEWCVEPGREMLCDIERVRACDCGPEEMMEGGRRSSEISLTIRVRFPNA